MNTNRKRKFNNSAQCKNKNRLKINSRSRKWKRATTISRSSMPSSPNLRCSTSIARIVNRLTSKLTKLSAPTWKRPTMKTMQSTLSFKVTTNTTSLIELTTRP